MENVFNTFSRDGFLAMSASSNVAGDVHVEEDGGYKSSPDSQVPVVNYSPAQKEQIESLMAQLKDCDDDPYGEVRACAAKGLGEVAQQGDQETIKALLTCLQETLDGFVGDPGIEFFGDDPHCPGGIHTVENGGQAEKRGVNDSREIVLVDGVKYDIENYKNLKKDVQTKIESGATYQLTFQDRERRVRRCAVEALGKVAEKGDQGMIKALIRLQDSEVRSEVCMVLAQVAEKGDAEVVNALIPFLGARSYKVQEDAAKALVKVANVGDEVVIEALKKNTGDLLTHDVEGTYDIFCDVLDVLEPEKKPHRDPSIKFEIPYS